MFTYHTTNVKTLVIFILFIINHTSSEILEKQNAENNDGTIEDSEMLDKNVYNETAVDEPCVGDPVYCNLTREEYTTMLNGYIYPKTYEWFLIATHSAVFVIGLVGNALVCIAVYRNHSMRTVTNYCIVNLAVADFLVILLCLPATVLWDVTETWFLGEALCKILLYFQSVSVTVSVLTLTFISIDRWYAICFPLKFKSTCRTKTVIFAIWTISLIFNCPDLLVLTLVKNVELRFDLQYLVQCSATWSSRSELAWHVIKFVIIYSIPLLLMTVAYYKIVQALWRSEKIPGQAETVKLAHSEQTLLRSSRRKAAKMLVAVVIMFAICYFPVHFLSVLRYMCDIEQNDINTFITLSSHVLCYVNSASNPVIYYFMSGNFHREFRRSFCLPVKPVNENSTTLTLTSRSKKDLTYHQGRTSTIIKNGYKNGYA